MAYQKKQEILSLSVPVIDIDRYNKNFDDPTAVHKVLSEITWEKMSFPVITFRKHTNSDREAKGTSTVGYVTGYNRDTNVFYVNINGKFSEVISGFEKTIVMPRATVNNEGETIITGIIIAPESDFAWMTKPRKPQQSGNYRGKFARK
jgi:hypothetical protein